MPATWNGTLSTGRSDLVLPGLAWPINLRPHSHARAMRLRLDERRERLILTYPRRVSQRTALDWAGQQAGWVETQIALVRPAEPFQPGAAIPFRGQAVRLMWREDLPRRPRLAGDMLSCGGSPESFAARI